MNIGFYRELEELRRDDPAADFGFLENVDVTPDRNAGHYLHGFCDEFAAMLSDTFGYPIECVRHLDDDGEPGKLIHAYCVAMLGGEKVYIDIRGITTNPALFFEAFENEVTYFPPDGELLDLEGPAPIELWTSKDTLFDGDYEGWTDESILTFIQENKSYYHNEELEPYRPAEPTEKGPKPLYREQLLHEIYHDEDLTVEEELPNMVLVWDNKDAKQIPFHFIEFTDAQSLAQRIHISKDIPAKYQVDKTALAEYLLSTCDRNAFITMEDLVVIWSEPEDPETFDKPDFLDSGAKYLCDKYGDEYAFELGEDVLGQLWHERNTVVINMGQIVRTSLQIADADTLYSDPYYFFENEVLIGFLTTAIHELRHLQLDTNIFLPEEDYPTHLASEAEVEEYCRETFEHSLVNTDILPHLYIVEKGALTMNEMTRLTREAEQIKKQYPVGTRILLEHMDDPLHPVPDGTKGTVRAVDSIGQLHMQWDNGRTLAVVPGVDSFRKLTERELAEEARKPSLEDQLREAGKKAPEENTKAPGREAQR